MPRERKASPPDTDDASIDAFAARDAAENDQRSTITVRYRAPELADLIARLSTVPWVSLRLGLDLVEYARARLGQLVVLTAASGAGKSSVAIETADHHAEHVGPVVYLSLELPADEVGARIISRRCGVSWEDATKGAVPWAEMERQLKKLPRLVVLAGDDATIPKAEAAVAALRSEYPGQPILLIVDYLQLLPGRPGEERIRVASIAIDLRRLAQRLGTVVIALSQTSRAVSKALGSGEIGGADTTSTGAETAQIEREAAVTLALGGMKPRDDGKTAVDISIGKGRMGQGDRVLPALYDGRTGAWQIVGPAITGAQWRAERTSANNDTRVMNARLAIPTLLAKADEPMSRSTVRDRLSINRTDCWAAIDALLGDSDSGVVEVRVKKPGKGWPLWTRSRADAAGLDVVPASVRSTKD